MMFGEDESGLAAKLINIYFTVFQRAVMGKDGKIDSEKAMNAKILSALLTGVNRAFPFTKADTEVSEGVYVMYM